MSLARPPDAITIDPYSLMSRFYDQWSAHMSDDVPFYVREASLANGPVVELGAGNGRVAIPIARAGVDVIAVDVSHAMLTEGARRAAANGVAEKMRWILGDMRTFVADEPVELVTIPARSFLHNLTTDDQLATLRAARASLVEGGRLICNIFTPSPHLIADIDGRAKLQTEFVDEHGRRCEVWATSVYDNATQLVDVRARLEVYDRDGTILRDEAETTLHLRMCYRYEFEHLLARAGFEVEALYGDFYGKEYGPGPDEMIWIARRA